LKTTQGRGKQKKEKGCGMLQDKKKPTVKPILIVILERNTAFIGTQKNSE